MADSQMAARDMRRVFLVNIFTLPLTLVLVIIGFFVSQPVGMVRSVSFGLLLFSVAFNSFAIHLIRQGVGRPLRVARIYLNLIVNIVLVYFLGGYFSPMWLILAIPPVSSAIYGTRRQTIVSVTQASVALIITSFLHGIHSPLGIGALVSRILFMVVVSFLINESMRTGDPTTGVR